jgi:hypothetical protein
MTLATLLLVLAIICWLIAAFQPGWTPWRNVAPTPLGLALLGLSLLAGVAFR